MFPLLGKDLPHLEEKIISYLGPVDLLRAKRSSRKWDRVIQKRINYLKAANDPAVMIQLHEDIMKGQVQTFKWWLLGGSPLKYCTSKTASKVTGFFEKSTLV